ncbi:MAG: hypothetical protein AAFV98_02855 [Chloroflexota bacterium]
MSDEQRTITDDMPLSDLTVGEFKALMREMLATVAIASTVDEDASDVAQEPVEQVEVKRKSLDEFMSGLG